MKRFHLILILLLTFAASLPAEAVKRAVVFGLGRQADAAWSTIHGDRDAEVVGKMLRECGFRDVQIVTNEQATKRGMVQALLDLTRRCLPGDVVYIHYSGHGQLMTDLNGDEAKRWQGTRHAGYDEAWIPYDAYQHPCRQDDGRRHFSDDDVETFLSAIRDRIGRHGQLYVVIDACHSGDATRGSGDDEPVRGVDTPFDMPRQYGTKLAQTRPERWLTVSACKPFQLCFEHKQPPSGKLTTAVCQLGARFFTMTARQIEEYLTKYMASHPGRLPQTPMVTGAK